MFGILSEAEMENILLSHCIGRIGCCENGQPYVVPVTYAYDGTCIYGQSVQGKKLELMRKNNKICFQVDNITDMSNWKSVLIEGRFVELNATEAKEAREYLFDRVFPLLTSSVIHSHEHEVITEVDDKNRVKPVMYKIVIDKKSGRFEQR